MTLLSYEKSSRILRDVVKTESFVPKCNIMTSGFFLTPAKVTPLKSCTFTKRFLLSLFASTLVIIESATITLKKIELLAFLVFVVNYLLLNFDRACRNAGTVLFIFKYILYRTVSSRWHYILIIITWNSVRH